MLRGTNILQHQGIHNCYICSSLCSKQVFYYAETLSPSFTYVHVTLPSFCHYSIPLAFPIVLELSWVLHSLLSPIRFLQIFSSVWTHLPLLAIDMLSTVLSLRILGKLSVLLSSVLQAKSSTHNYFLFLSCLFTLNDWLCALRSIINVPPSRITVSKILKIVDFLRFLPCNSAGFIMSNFQFPFLIRSWLNFSLALMSVALIAQYAHFGLFATGCASAAEDMGQAAPLGRTTHFYALLVI